MTITLNVWADVVLIMCVHIFLNAMWCATQTKTAKTQLNVAVKVTVPIN